MNYQQVKQFLTIVKHMNLSKAANELYISQPALSLALGRLESELDVQLFYRDGKKLIISPAGEQLYDSFMELKEAHDHLTDTAAAIRNGENCSSLTIGFSLSALFFSTLYMNGCLNSFESVTLNKLFADADQILTMLKNGMIDFAVTCPPLEDEKVSNETILTEEYVLVVSSGHPLASRKNISVTELKNVGLTGLRKNQPTRKQNDFMCTQNHFTPVYLHEYDYPDYYSAIKESAFTDRFANLVSRDFLEKTYGRGFVSIPFSDGNMVRQTTISWITEKKNNLEYQRLLDHVIRCLQEQQLYHLQFSEIMSKMF